MAALTPLQRKRRKDQIQTAFNEYKSVGTTLLQLGKIDSEEYYTRVRNKGINLGIITSNQYPDALPGWVEPVFRITGATAGAILAAPAVITGPGGVAAMSAGAGAGGAAATAAYQQFADFFSDDMPIKPVKEKLKDIGMAGVVDTTATFAFGGAAHMIGRGLAKTRQGTVSGARNIYNMGDKKLSEAATNAKKGRIGGKYQGVFVTEVERADELARQISAMNITPTFGMVGREGLRYIMAALGKMPLIGIPARKAHENTVRELIAEYTRMTAQYRGGVGFSQPFMIDKATGRSIIRTDGGKASEEFLERLQKTTPWSLISHVQTQGAIKKDAYKAAYKHGFDDILQNVKSINISRMDENSLGRVINKEVRQHKLLYGDSVPLPAPIAKLLNRDGIFNKTTLSGKEVFGIQNVMKMLAKEKSTGRGMPESLALNINSMNRIRAAALHDATKYSRSLKDNLAKADVKYRDYKDFLSVNRPVFAHVEQLNLGVVSGTVAKADIEAGKKMLAELSPKSSIITNKLGEIKMGDAWAAPSGGGVTNAPKLLKDYAFNPQRQEVLRKAMGQENYKKFAITQLDDVFNKNLFNRYNAAGVERGISEAGNFNPTKLSEALGISGKNAAANWRLTEAMLKESGLNKSITKQSLTDMVDVLRLIPELPSLSSFLVRSFTLKGTAGPAAILGGGALAGGVGGLVMATGPLMLFTHLMSKPYSKQLIANAIKNPGKYGSALNQEIEKVTNASGFLGKSNQAIEKVLSRVDQSGFVKYNEDLRKGLTQIAVEASGQATGVFKKPEEDFYKGRLK
jgi:hypothetical protein